MILSARFPSWISLRFISLLSRLLLIQFPLNQSLLEILEVNDSILDHFLIRESIVLASARVETHSPIQTALVQVTAPWRDFKVVT